MHGGIQPARGHEDISDYDARVSWLDVACAWIVWLAIAAFCLLV